MLMDASTESTDTYSHTSDPPISTQPPWVVNVLSVPGIEAEVSPFGSPELGQPGEEDADGARVSV